LRNSLFTLIAGEKLDYLLANSVEICAKLYQNLCGNAFAFANEPKQNMFGTNVVVAKLKRFTE
jgi:hypothetical protein